MTDDTDKDVPIRNWPKPRHKIYWDGRIDFDCGCRSRQETEEGIEYTAFYQWCDADQCDGANRPNKFRNQINVYDCGCKSRNEMIDGIEMTVFYENCKAISCDGANRSEKSISQQLDLPDHYYGKGRRPTPQETPTK